jgi:prepilin-type N-terminal cleavage/methylation domain-containing protein
VRIASIALPPRKHAPGFTLIELLLAVFLLSLLFGALVFNFTNLQPGAELAEGAERFKSLLRFARAQAAFSGCRVQVRFEPDDADPFSPNLYHLRLTWEPDPWENPGIYVDLLPSAWDLEGINKTVTVTQVAQPTTSGPALRGAETASTAPMEPGAKSASEPTIDLESEAAPEWPEDTVEPMAAALPPITFFPDGTSDSAQILLAARAAEDRRKVLVHLAGITGSITHEWIAPAQGETTEAERDDWIDEFLEEMAAAEPVP